MLTQSDLRQVKSLFNQEFTTRNSRTRVYSRIPSATEGYENEIRHVSVGDRAWVFHKINKGWWSIELGRPLIERWDDVRVAFSNVRLPASGAPTWTSYKGSQVLAFSKSATNTVHFIVQFPHSRKDGSPIDPHVHWVSPDANAGKVKLQFTYSWANVHGIFPTETTVTATGSTLTNADQHLVTDFGLVAGDDKLLSSMMLCSFARLGGDAADTYNEVIYALEFDFHAIFNDRGSINEYKKELIRIS